MKTLVLVLLGSLLAVPGYADRGRHGPSRGHGDGGRIMKTHRHGGHFHGRSFYRPYIYRHWPGFHGNWAYHGRPYYRPGGYTSVGVGFYGDELSYGRSRGNYAGTGLWLGALTGAVIGHNSGDLRHNGWLGAGLGAAAGYVIGSAAEKRAQRREAAETPPALSYRAQAQTVDPSAATSEASPASPAPAVPARTNSMSAANSLFGR